MHCSSKNTAGWKSDKLMELYNENNGQRKRYKQHSAFL